MAKNIISTTVTFHGGNAFVPVMKMIEDRKDRIVTAINKRFGKPGEVEAGQERVRAEPKQTWGDTIKGRFVSWLIVFSSLVTADALLRKDKNNDYRFDKFEDGFGRVVAGLTKSGKDIWSKPFSEKLTLADETNKAYRFGKILALDIYATAASLLIWTATSKFFAATRGRKALKNKPDAADPLIDAARDIATHSDHDDKDRASEKRRHFTPERKTENFRERAYVVQTNDVAPAL